MDPSGRVAQQDRRGAVPLSTLKLEYSPVYNQEVDFRESKRSSVRIQTGGSWIFGHCLELSPLTEERGLRLQNVEVAGGNRRMTAGTSDSRGVHKVGLKTGLGMPRDRHLGRGKQTRALAVSLVVAFAFVEGDRDILPCLQIQREHQERDRGFPTRRQGWNSNSGFLVAMESCGWGWRMAAVLCGASDRLESEDPDMRWEAIGAESTPEKTCQKFSSTSQT